MEEILLVNKEDKPLGYMEKIKAHEDGGTLHRAFSVFIYNDLGEMLLQKRAIQKYHFGDLWTNACCSHQTKADSTIKAAAHRRLNEEFGFDTDLTQAFEFYYQADFSNGLSEHEYDHTYIGKFNGKPNPNPEEISNYKWVKLQDLEKDIEANPESYTPWFKIALEQKNKLLFDFQQVIQKQKSK